MPISDNSKKSGQIPAAIWTIKDILVVTFWVISAWMIIYFPIMLVIGNSKISFLLARFVGSLIEIFFPIYWIKKKYRLNKDALGLKKSSLSIWAIIFIGAGSAIFYYTLFRMAIFGFNPTHFVTNDLILPPRSFLDLMDIILVPISEEILMRGLLYGYLRKRIGVIWGLNVQALLFSASHIMLFHYANGFYLFIDGFLIGLILGIMYEKTRSLYPSMICHATINYIASYFSP